MKSILLAAGTLLAASAASAATTIAEWNNFGAIAGAGTNPTSFTNLGTGYVAADGSFDLAAGTEARNATRGVAGVNQAYTTLGGAISVTNGTTAWAVAMKVSNLAAGNNTLFTLSTTTPYEGLYGLSVNTTTGVVNFANFTTLTSPAVTGWSTNYTAGQELTFSFYRTAAGALSTVISGLAGGDVTVTGSTGANFSGKTLTNLYLGTSVNPTGATYVSDNTTNFPVDNQFKVLQLAVLTGNMTTAELAAPFTLTAIPEPSTYGLLGAGALTLAAVTRRRRRTA